MKYLLDTNIVSDAIKPQPQEALARWVEGQSDDALYLSATSVAEVLRGILELPVGRKRRLLEQWYTGADGPRRRFGSRILGFDEAAAEVWAGFLSDGRRKGRPRNAIDMMIAATATVNDCTLAPLNLRDFEGVVELVNPIKD